jgi:hypothetical protein
MRLMRFLESAGGPLIQVWKLCVSGAVAGGPLIQVWKLCVSGAVPRSSRLYRDERVLAETWEHSFSCTIIGSE